MKNKKVKTLTSELEKTWELKNMIGFQFTFGPEEDGIMIGHTSFNFVEREYNGMRNVQTSMEETNVAPLIAKILNFKISSRYFGQNSFDFTKEEFEKLCNIFKELGHEVEKSKHSAWYWLHIKNTNKDLIEDQLKEIAAKFHTVNTEI